VVAGRPGADLVIRGRVAAQAQDAAVPGAVAVRAGRIVALGDAALSLVRDAAEVLDAEGVLRPSFGDGHAHPLWGGLELAGPAVRDAGSVAEVVEAVRAYAERNPALDWVVGGPYEPSLAPGGRFDAAWLDAAVPDRPVVLQSADHHCAWVNSEALRRAGVGPDVVDPPAGEVVRRDDGSVLGTLVEWSAMDLVQRHVPAPSDADRLAALERSSALLAAEGITWVQEAALAPGDVAAYLTAAESGRLSVRANIALRAEPGQWPAQRADFVTARAQAAARGSGAVSARTVKFFADGVIEAGTAALHEPYADAPHSCGLPVWTPTELAEAAAAFDQDGFQLHIHAIGDAGITSALDAIEHVQRRNGRRDRRPVIAHVQLPRPSDVPRFAELGVIACLQPLWAQLDPLQVELTQPRLGAARSALQYPFAGIARAGGRLSAGSDWPVSSFRPLECLAVAVTRSTPEGRPPQGWIPDERLTAGQALAAGTAGVAYQAFEESAWGRLTVGGRADLVEIAEDPAAVPAGRWSTLTVVRTWLGGRLTHGG
jgi:hypothetical protein